MRVVWRAVLVLVVFIGVGVLSGYGVMAHVQAAGAAAPEVRLSAAMAGLCAGSLAALVAIIAVVRMR